MADGVREAAVEVMARAVAESVDRVPRAVPLVVGARLAAPPAEAAVWLTPERPTFAVAAALVEVQVRVEAAPPMEEVGASPNAVAHSLQEMLRL